MMQSVLRVNNIDLSGVCDVFSAYSLDIAVLPEYTVIPGSYWGDCEAGLIGQKLFVRPDTPLHSLFHEACHYICMDSQRRAALNTDAGGDYQEENGVCYLQILLADYCAGFSRVRMFADMDTWGYSFRLGSAQAWFEQDAEDAVQWLIAHQLIDKEQRPTWRLRVT